MFILRIFYNLFILLFTPIAVPIGYIFAIKRNEQEGYFQRFGFISLPKPPAKTVWFHCASVGEVRSLNKLISMFRDEYKDAEIIISTTTASGGKVARKELKPYFSFLLPLENPIAISRILKKMNVKATVIIDTELWPNFIYLTSEHAPLFLVNARLSDKSMKGYKRIRKIISLLLRRFTCIYTKSQEDTEKFVELQGSSENIRTLGNIKFGEFGGEPDLSVIKLLTDKPFIVAGSTHRGEEEIIAKAFIKSGFQGRLIIAPRHINRVTECICILRRENLTVCTLSNFDARCRAVIIDSFGHLEALFKAADKIFIGGSLTNVGGHNIFEALKFGRHISVGKYMQNIQETYELACRFSLASTVVGEDDLAQYFSQTNQENDFEGFKSYLENLSSEKFRIILEALKVALNS